MEQNRLKRIQDILDRTLATAPIPSGIDEIFDMAIDETPDPVEPQFTGKKLRHFGVFDGETRFGPHLWRFRKNVPWRWIVSADEIGVAGTHVRTGLMIWAMASAYRAYELRPVRICRDDSDHIRVKADRMTEYLRGLADAGLITAEFHPRRKTRVLPINLATTKETGPWKIPRGVWWAPISHISCHQSHSALMAYLFLAMHYSQTRKTANPNRELPGWTRPRKDFERGTKELRESGLIVKNSILDYSMPVLFKPAEGVDLKPGWLTPTPKKRNKWLEPDKPETFEPWGDDD